MKACDTLLGAALLLACGLLPGASRAQEAFTHFSAANGPTLEEYLKEAPKDAKVVEAGKLKIDGRTATCGKRPTVLITEFDSWGGAFPGFLILNTKKINGLTTAVKLYIYSHECGHQFVGASETEADRFAIRRGVKYGWLDAVGMEDICAFISTLKGDAVHPPGPERCETMRKFYNSMIESGKDQAASAAPAPSNKPKPSTLAPE